MAEAASTQGGTGRLLAASEGVLVATLWSSSFVLVKSILATVGPLTIAALRYGISCLVLLPFIAARRVPIRAITARMWLRLALIGLTNFAIGNGAAYVALKFLPATTVSFLGSLIPLLVLLGGLVWLREVPTRWQVAGMAVTLAGSAMFFWRGWQPVDPVGLAIYLVGMVAFAAAAVLSRDVARGRVLDTLTLTALPVGLGGGMLLPLALAVEGLPVLTTQAGLVIGFLAAINTTLGYLLYYHALRELAALEMNIILNLMPFGTAVVAWLLLDERLTAIQIAAMCVGLVGVSLVQVARREGASG